MGKNIKSDELKQKVKAFEKEKLKLQKAADKAMRKACNDLERKLKQRTLELEIKTNHLKEANAALKVILEKRKQDKHKLEDNVLSNVGEMVLPYIEKLKKTQMDDRQKVLVKIIESHLKEVISPFSRELSTKYLGLTPTEIKIANLIRHGSTSKGIAKLMNISARTVDTHRKNIRKKIGLGKKKANLRSHLLAFP